MKKFFVLAAMVALVAAALAVPALAQNNGGLVNFGDCFPFCDDNNREANQDVDQQSRQAFEQEARDFDRFDDEEEFFDFFEDRFDDEEEFFNFFDDGFGGGGDEAAISNEIGQESESGDVAIGFSVDSSGDYAQQCIAPLQFGNTGNLQNAQGFVQYQTDTDDIGFEGSSFEFSPTLAVQCDQAVQQSAAASSR